MVDTVCAQIFKEDQEKVVGAYAAQSPWQCEGKDKENGSSNQGMGQLLLHSERQKTDGRIR